MKKFFRILVPVLMGALIIASIGWYLFVYDRDFTRDMLLAQARYQDLHGNARLSAWFYDLAYEHSGRDENVAVELANQYKSDGNYTKAEVTLSKALYTNPTTELYIALCKTYVEQDKLMDAVSLLESIQDPAIRASIETLRPSAPTADFEPGFYSKYISVSLISQSGTVYCTTDGDYPSVADAPYSKPVSLPAGETVIQAICVDDTGLVSPLTVLGYTVGGVIEPAVFIDPAIEASVRELLDIGEGKILYTDALWGITEFTVPTNAASLDDLALMPYLVSLTAADLQLDNLDGLSSLRKLEKLDLSGSRFPANCLETAAGLPALEELNLSACSLSTISGLEAAGNLRILNISNNSVRNLEPLSSLVFLTELSMDHNALTSLDAISALTALETLDVSYNSLTSLQAIGGCAKLRTLNAAGNRISNLSGVSQLGMLSSLALDYNVLTDITLLGSCTGLTELRISNNTISDLSALDGLTALEIFDFSYNQVESLPDWPSSAKLRIINGAHNVLTSIDVLGGMADLTYVSMDYNALTSVDALENCANLVQVNVYGNEIDDVSALTAHNIIVNYDPT